MHSKLGSTVNSRSGTLLLQFEDDLAEQICQRGKQPDSDTNLWACLGRLVNYKDDSHLPRQTLAANAGIFFAAGYETTAHAITWALFELAADPSLQVGFKLPAQGALISSLALAL